MHHFRIRETVMVIREKTEAHYDKTDLEERWSLSYSEPYIIVSGAVEVDGETINPIGLVRIRRKSDGELRVRDLYITLSCLGPLFEPFDRSLFEID